MGAMSRIDIDLQELLATVATVADECDIYNADSEQALDGRAILLSRLDALGWVTPTEAAARQSADLL